MIPFLATVAAQAAAQRGAPLKPEETARLQALYQAHHDIVWRVLRRSGLSEAQADDGSQQVFLVALTRLADITAGRERSFLCGSAVMVARKLKQKHVREVLPERLPEVDSGSRPDEQAEHRRNRALLDKALARMEEPLRAVFVLQEIEGLTKRETAEALGIPEGTVATRIRRARAAFDELISGELGGAR